MGHTTNIRSKIHMSRETKRSSVIRNPIKKKKKIEKKYSWKISRYFLVSVKAVRFFVVFRYQCGP